MKMLAAENIPVLISDDAHSVTQLGNHFEEASVLAKQSGITNFYKTNSERNNITSNLTPNRSNIDR